ncbi:hypothetical protein FBZ93_114179 [Bradyrhizobium macuxiense]|uniref:Uncharacterized protein n=1 Tax=Bradyrhizobium macuxiense TaxID=1755647 RepID=A0A560L5P4_9BRAD|nr:hypothetical protein FBZ93_114179 [Bradyrhizobium macuxiense]
MTIPCHGWAADAASARTMHAASASSLLPELAEENSVKAGAAPGEP